MLAFLKSTRRAPFNSTPMGVNSISSGSPHVRCTPMWALSTCGEPDEIKKNTHPKNITTALFRDQVRRTEATRTADVSYANACCCTLRPRTTPPPEENSILGVTYGALLWVAGSLCPLRRCLRGATDRAAEQHGAPDRSRHLRQRDAQLPGQGLSDADAAAPRAVRGCGVHRELPAVRHSAVCCQRAQLLCTQRRAANREGRVGGGSFRVSPASAHAPRTHQWGVRAANQPNPTWPPLAISLRCSCHVIDGIARARCAAGVAWMAGAWPSTRRRTRTHGARCSSSG